MQSWHLCATNRRSSCYLWRLIVSAETNDNHATIQTTQNMQKCIETVFFGRKIQEVDSWHMKFCSRQIQKWIKTWEKSVEIRNGDKSFIVETIWKLAINRFDRSWISHQNIKFCQCQQHCEMMKSVGRSQCLCHLLSMPN